MSIKLSKQHGANPSINICFFCGKDKELVLFGHMKDDAKAPKRVMLDYIPCKECAEKMKQGVVVIEVTCEADSYRPPIKKDEPQAWPTGRWCVISAHSASKLFPASFAGSHVLVEDELYSKLVERMKK